MSQTTADTRTSGTALPSDKRLEIQRVLAALREDGYISDEDVQRAQTAVREQRAGVDIHPLILIANLKFRNLKRGDRELTLEALTLWLAHRCKLRYLRIDPTKIDVPAVSVLISQTYAQRHRILPVAVNAENVIVATSEPTDLRWVRDLSKILRRDITIVVSNPLDLSRYTMEFFGVTRSVRGAKDQREENKSTSMPSFEQLVELGRTGEVGADDHHIVHIVDWLLQYAYEQRASDIHLEPRRDVSRVRFRIDGLLHKVFELPTPVMIAAISRVKVLGRMDLGERRRPQDGRIKTRSPGGREVEMRLSTIPTAFGEKC
ncbi:MAG: Flp pilus assembly complex ATPase component TadA, partial [Xanthomonadales bacterium]|nr:Flp pilus assembly complex ATPase component TadA [Xanthomonadales bacterium]